MISRRQFVGGTTTGVIVALAGCSGNSEEPDNNETNLGRDTEDNNTNDEEDISDNPDATIAIGNRLPVGYDVSVSVELGDASAASIEYNDEEIKAVNQDGSYDIAGFDDDGVMDVSDVETGDTFTVYAIYADSYVELASEVAIS